MEYPRGKQSCHKHHVTGIKSGQSQEGITYHRVHQYYQTLKWLLLCEKIFAYNKQNLQDVTQSSPLLIITLLSYLLSKFHNLNQFLIVSGSKIGEYFHSASQYLTST